MEKVFGQISGYSPVRFDRSRTIISYGMEEVDETHATWYEQYYYKKQIPVPTLEMIKNDIISFIDSQTDEKILSGFVWNDIHVWLNAENQRNYSEADRKAKDNPELVLPVTFKLGEDTDKNPVYHTFTTYEELDGFYMQAFKYINLCLNEGWQKKDSIDWDVYKAYFPSDEPIEEQ